MKKQNRFCIVITTIILLFLVSCVDRTGKYIFYQFKNETGEDLKLKFYYKIKERAQRNNPNLRVVEIKSKRAIKPLVRPVLSLVNETFKDIYAFTPMTDKEMDEFADRYLMILDPRFLKIIKNENDEKIGRAHV